MLELFIVLAIVGLLLRVSMPGLSAMVSGHRSDAVVKTLSTAIQLAREAAITSGGLVTLCKSADGEHCGGEWQQGILVFVDADDDQELEPEQGALAYLRVADGDGEIRWRAFRNRQYLQFVSTGGTRYQNGNFTYCPADNDASQARQLVLNRMGRVRHARDTDGDGVVEDSRGRPVTCPM